MQALTHTHTHVHTHAHGRWRPLQEQRLCPAITQENADAIWVGRGGLLSLLPAAHLWPGRGRRVPDGQVELGNGMGGAGCLCRVEARLTGGATEASELCKQEAQPRPV